MRKRKRTRFMHQEDAVVVLLLGLLLGTVFTFFVGHTNATISLEETTPVTATFARYEEQGGTRYRFGRVRSHTAERITLHFTDHDDLELDPAIMRTDLRNALNGLSAGTALSLRLHPNSGGIVAIEANGTSLLDFPTAMSRLSQERVGFQWFGGVLYLGAAWALFCLTTGRVKK